MSNTKAYGTYTEDSAKEVENNGAKKRKQIRYFF